MPATGLSAVPVLLPDAQTSLGCKCCSRPFPRETGIHAKFMLTFSELPSPAHITWEWHGDGHQTRGVQRVSVTTFRPRPTPHPDPMVASASRLGLSYPSGPPSRPTEDHRLLSVLLTYFTFVSRFPSGTQQSRAQD